MTGDPYGRRGWKCQAAGLEPVDLWPYEMKSQQDDCKVIAKSMHVATMWGSYRVRATSESSIKDCGTSY